MDPWRNNHADCQWRIRRTAVTAVPDAEFGFVGWSDGRTDNPRTDEAVDGDVTVTATFAPSIVPIYNAGPNGTLTGATEQLIGEWWHEFPGDGGSQFGFWLQSLERWPHR